LARSNCASRPLADMIRRTATRNRSPPSRRRQRARSSPDAAVRADDRIDVISADSLGRERRPAACRDRARTVSGGCVRRRHRREPQWTEGDGTVHRTWSYTGPPPQPDRTCAYCRVERSSCQPSRAHGLGRLGRGVASRYSSRGRPRACCSGRCGSGRGDCWFPALGRHQLAVSLSRARRQ
jgi:hypothetical protein